MPTVQKYQPGQVQSQPLPGVRRSVDAPIEAFGGGASNIAPAVGGAISDLDKVYQAEKKKNDDVRTQDAYAQAVKKKNQLFYDPKNGAVTRRGRDAAGIMDEFNPQFETAMDDIEESLGNSDQKAQFRLIRSRVKADFDDNLTKHSYGEGEKFAKETHESVLENNQNDTAINLSQPGKIAAGFELQKNTLVDWGRKHGWGAEVMEQELEKANTQLHAKIINQYMSMNQDMAAKKYLEENKDSIKDADSLAKMQESVQNAYSLGESQRQAGDLIAASKGNFTKALASAREKLKDEPDVLKLTIADIHARKNEFDEAKRDSDKERDLWSINFTEKNKKLPPGNVWSRLEPNMRTYLQGILSGERTNTDLKTYYRLDRMSGDPTLRQDFIRTNLYDFVGSLKPEHFTHFSNLQSAMTRGDDKIGQKLDGIQSKTGIVDDNLREMNLDPTPKEGTEEASGVALFRARVDQDIAQFQREHGRDVTNEDVRMITKRLRVEAVKKVPGYLWGTNTEKTLLYKTKPGDEVAIAVKDIPPDDLRKIQQALVRKMAPITEAAVIKMFNERFNRSGN